MPTIKNQTVTAPSDSRARLAERLSKRFPDRRFVSGDGQDGQDGLADMEQSALDYLDEYETQNKEYKDNNDKLLQLFDTDPLAGEFLTRWSSTGDPIQAMVSIFGEEKIRAAIDSEAGRESFAAGQKEWLARKEADDNAVAARETNFQQSLKDLDAFGNEKGLDDDMKTKVIMRLIDLADSACDGKLTRDDYQMAYNALNYDKDVAAAKEEGTLAGRNEKIREVRASSAEARNSRPNLAGQAASISAPKPVRRSEGSLWGLE